MKVLGTITSLKTILCIMLFPVVFASAAYAQTQGDFDGDGREDMVFWNRETYEATVLLLNGAEQAGTLQRFAVGPDFLSQILSVGDLDGDEAPDFVWSHPGENDLLWGTFSEDLTTSKIAQSDTPDTMLSLLTALKATPKVISRASALDGGNDLNYESYYSIQPQSVSDSRLYAYAVVASPVGVAGVYAAKFAVEDETFKLASDLMRVADLPEGNLYPIEFGDFNSDGFQDILWQDASNGGILIWMMKEGQLIESQAAEFPPFKLGWSIAAAIDLDGDRADELILRDAKSDRLAYWPIGGDSPVLLPMEAPGSDWVLVPSLWSGALSQVWEFSEYR